MNSSKRVPKIFVIVLSVFSAVSLGAEAADDAESRKLDEAMKLWTESKGEHEAMELLCAGTEPVLAFSNNEDTENGESNDIVTSLLDKYLIEPAIDSSDQDNVLYLLANALINIEMLCGSVSSNKKFYYEVAAQPYYVESKKGDGQAFMVASTYINHGLLLEKDRSLLFEGRIGVVDPTNEALSAQALARVAYAWTANELGYAFRPHAPRSGRRAVIGFNLEGESDSASDSDSIGSHGVTLEYACRNSKLDFDCNEDIDYTKHIWDYSLSFSSKNNDDGVSGETFGVGLGVIKAFDEISWWCGSCFAEAGASYEYGNLSAGEVSGNGHHWRGYLAFEKMMPIDALSLRFEAGYAETNDWLTLRADVEEFNAEYYFGSISLVYRNPAKYIRVGVRDKDTKKNLEPFFPSIARAVSYSGSYRQNLRVGEIISKGRVNEL